MMRSTFCSASRRRKPFSPGCLAALLLGLTLLSPSPSHAAQEPALATNGEVLSAGPDRQGLRRDSAFLLSYQVGTVAFLYVLPESVTNWTDEDRSEYGLGKWWDNIRNPQWDSDDFYLNYVLHPYWGAAYYVRARERGFDEYASFWYSFAMSSAFEFGVEALFEEPSLQDIVVTPVGGIILGEYFMDLRDRTEALYDPGEEMAWRHRAMLVLTDPIGALNRQVQSWVGMEETEASLRLYTTGLQPGFTPRFAGDAGLDDRVYGLRFDFRW
ncbi:DUF3943 domain-containing protein [Thioalkalivibrio sp. XN8]|uniref:DUF3943 domain-containing protein n=1 Tax=Thioalkalivibrio sp. XN8 TaxID=2712863 RepID=UPI0013ECABA4|nr:DUF3943 domain-containing protein [Thioalkalivibrio sp. XN8]NGP54341.1 DUF3943 domain-containing protein [Thioalkalivibrio sp. XN8]